MFEASDFIIGRDGGRWGVYRLDGYAVAAGFESSAEAEQWIWTGRVSLFDPHGVPKPAGFVRFATRKGKRR